MLNEDWVINEVKMVEHFQSKLNYSVISDLR